MPCRCLQNAVIRFACLAFAGLWATPAFAVNFATGVKQEQGYQLKLYPFYYYADTRTDKDGNPAVTGLGMQKYGVMIGNTFQVGNLQLNAIIPVAKLEIARQKSSDTGIGDIQLRAGWSLPLDWMSVLPVLLLKAPTGSFDKQRPANLGDGQADLAAELYLFKLWSLFSCDALFKYNLRFRNPDSDLTPGNEFSTEWLATVRLAEKIRIGPALNFLIGEDNKRAGRTLPDSGLMRLSAGGEIFYGRLEHLKISLAAYQDLATRNTNQGVLVMSRIAFVF